MHVSKNFSQEKSVTRLYNYSMKEQQHYSLDRADILLTPRERTDLLSLAQSPKCVNKEMLHSIRNTRYEHIPLWLHDKYQPYNLSIDYIAFFVFGEYIPAGRSFRMLHSDLDWDGAEWYPCKAALNYELTRYTTRMEWWDMTESRQTAFYPTEHEHLGIRPNGIHYGSRNTSSGIPGEHTGARKLDEGVLDAKPVIIRTDVPHIVYAEEFIKEERVSISIRFKENPSIGELYAKLQQRPVGKDDTQNDTSSRSKTV
jgi:hypothetical protein